MRQKWGFTGGAGDGEGVTGAQAATGKTARPKSYAGEGDDGEWNLILLFMFKISELGNVKTRRNGCTV